MTNCLTFYLATVYRLKFASLKYDLSKSSAKVTVHRFADFVSYDIRNRYKPNYDKIVITE